MPRRAELLNSLTRGRIRTSWNKYNLFNLYKKSQISFQSKNLNQQKWTAKQETRAYHGEHITEGRWKHFFSQKLESVAQLDASLRGETSAPTPVLLQTYAVLEKRLDFALFRAMFASSVRQARQFILTGNVYVNDVKITQPNYILKAGDVFHCNPEKVLIALGAQKPSLKKSYKITKQEILLWNNFVKRAKANPYEVWKEMRDKNRGKMTEEDRAIVQAKIKSINKEAEKEMLDKQNYAKSRANILSDILSLGLAVESTKLSSAAFTSKFDADTAKHALKAYEKAITLEELNVEELKTSLPKWKESYSTIKKLFEPKDRKDVEKKKFSELRQIIASVQSSHMESVRLESKAKMIDSHSDSIPYHASWSQHLKCESMPTLAELEENESKAKSIRPPYQEGLYGRFNPKKHYFTPWKVRPFIAPFAILPSHIEISFETCHAVYMRDPVAYPGYSEVISPFALPVHERAYMWYINRTKRKFD